MDDDIKSLRARHWHSTNDASDNEFVSPGDKGDQSKATIDPMINFGETSYRGDTSDHDDELVRQQLKRKSMPYSWTPPTSTKSENSKVYTTPGIFPQGDQFTTRKPERKSTPMPETKPNIKKEDDERTCRICLSPQTPDERLISPCKCRGTSKWIHLSCLNEWRKVSRNSKSFYRCDQCQYEYSFRRTDLAELLLSKYTLLVLTAFAFTIAMFFGGFFIKFGLYLYPPERLMRQSSWFSSFFYTPFDAGTDMLSAASALVPTTPRSIREIFVIDVWHFLQGFISLGIIGVVGFLGTGGLFSLRTFMPNGRRRRHRGDGIGFGELAFIVVLVLGCGKVAHAMWKRVRELVRVKLATLGEKILEVDPDEV